MLSEFSFRAGFDLGSFEPTPFNEEGLPKTRSESFGTSPDLGNAFGRVVRLVQDNDRLFAAYQVTTSQLRQARNYLADPSSNPLLAKVHLDRIRLRRSGLLAQLRANRIEAQSLLEVPLSSASSSNATSQIQND